MSLKDRLKAQIAAAGPISVAQYMMACLHDPLDGYYATQPKLGEDGDFITAPLVSQMFGELLGLWAVETWVRLGRPARVVFAEVGPGDGTLMADALRAAKLSPGFLAAEVWLVEASPVLAGVQRERLGEGPNWAGSLSEIPSEAPLILIANELLDCLPANQFMRTAEGWAERVIGLGDAGDLAFGLRDATFLPPLAGEVSRGRRQVTMGAVKPDSLPPSTLGLRPSGNGFPRERGKQHATSLGMVVESSPAQEAFAAELAARIVRTGGAALLIDYGSDRPEPGDTLQALQRHRKVDPLACPGEADLTVHADFPAVLAAARNEGAATAILTQGELLRRLGIEARAAALKAARPDRADTISRQVERLTAPDQMGELFKAAAIWSPATAVPPGFEEA